MKPGLPMNPAARAAIPPTGQVERCAAHGAFTSEDITLGGFTLRGGCPKCRESREIENKKRHDELAARENQLRVENAIINSGIPRRYLGATIETYRPYNEGTRKSLQYATFVIKNFDALMEKGVSLVMSGQSGTGKTHLGCAIVRKLIESGYSAAYVNAMDMLARVKETWSNGQSSGDVVRSFVAPQMLVIDEVGLQGQSNTDYSLLFQIINGRYERALPMIIISNLTPQALSAHLNERVMDRLLESSDVVLFDWESYRTAAEERA